MMDLNPTNDELGRRSLRELDSDVRKYISLGLPGIEEYKGIREDINDFLSGRKGEIGETSDPNRVAQIYRLKLQRLTNKIR